MFSDVCHGGGDGDMRQVRAILKCRFADVGNAFRKNHVRDPATADKRICGNFRDPIRDDNACQGKIIGKHSRLEFPNLIWNGNVVENFIVQYQRMCISCRIGIKVAELYPAPGLQIGNAHGRKPPVVSKRTRSDCRQRSGKRQC